MGNGPAAHPDQIETDQRRQPNHGDDAATHLRWRDQSGARHACGANSIRRIGAAEVVGIVIGKVAQDLQQQRTHSGSQRRQPGQPAVGKSQCCPHDHWGERSRQCLGACGKNPCLSSRNSLSFHHLISAI